MSPSKSNPPRSRARHFVTGIITIIPLGVTALVLVYLVRFLSAVGRYPAIQLKKLASNYFDVDAEWVNSQWFLDTFAVIVILMLIYFLGMMTSNFLGRRIIMLFEAILARIPFVKTVYGAVKKLVDLMRQDGDSDGQRVVLIEFPSPEMKTVGLVTRTFRDTTTGREVAAVFVPTTPNPTNGYLEIVPVEKITGTDWSFDEAMSFVVSGGAIAPQTMNYDRSPPNSSLPPAGPLPEPPSQAATS